MVAGSSTCSCAECGTVCEGRFSEGCRAVWRRGPRTDAPSRPVTHVPVGLALTSVNGNGSARLASVLQAEPSHPTVVDSDLRVAQLQAALARLSEELAEEVRRRDDLARQLADLGKVLGELGVEIDDRFDAHERALEGLKRRRADSPPSPRQGPSEEDLAGWAPAKRKPAKQ